MKYSSNLVQIFKKKLDFQKKKLSYKIKQLLNTKMN